MTADALALLTDERAEQLVRAALAPDEELVRWRVRSVDHRPGGRATVAYDTVLRGRDGEARRVVGATTAEDAAGLPVVHVDGVAVTVWPFPLDPALPALATATDDAAVRDVLQACGVRARHVRLDVRAYRPRRRAVVEVRTSGPRLFLKVVRPARAEALHARHAVLRAAGLPVPRSLGVTATGLVVVEALEGSTLRDRLRAGGPVPDAAALLALVHRLPAALCDLPRRRSWSDDVAHYAAVTAAALPAEAERCRQLADRIVALLGERPADEPSHGDLYEAQLLVDAGRVTGLLDVDTAGPGRRADDLACLLAHVSVLAQREPEHADRSRAQVRTWLSDLDRVTDPAELRARAAGVVVSLATGPHRVQEAGWQDATRARLDLAESWLVEAERRS